MIVPASDVNSYSKSRRKDDESGTALIITSSLHIQQLSIQNDQSLDTCQPPHTEIRYCATPRNDPCAA